eukprot:1158551-Pelagomonas_calceolata.AAC.2
MKSASGGMAWHDARAMSLKKTCWSTRQEHCKRSDALSRHCLHCTEANAAALSQLHHCKCGQGTLGKAQCIGYITDLLALLAMSQRGPTKYVPKYASFLHPSAPIHSLFI